MTSRKTNKTRFDLASFLARVGKGRTIGIYARTRVIFSQGDAADSLFYIQKGKVKLAVVSAQGKEGVIAILDEGEFFGEAWLGGQVSRIATAAAITECVAVRLDKA